VRDCVRGRLGFTCPTCVHPPCQATLVDRYGSSSKLVRAFVPTQEMARARRGASALSAAALAAGGSSSSSSGSSFRSNSSSSSGGGGGGGSSSDIEPLLVSEDLGDLVGWAAELQAAAGAGSARAAAEAEARIGVLRSAIKKTTVSECLVASGIGPCGFKGGVWRSSGGRAHGCGLAVCSRMRVVGSSANGRALQQPACPPKCRRQQQAGVATRRRQRRLPALLIHDAPCAWRHRTNHAAIKTYIHAVTKSDGTGFIPDSIIDAQIQVL
jgi:hypothetical protein